MVMASCQPKIPEIKYKDEGWWREFFEKDLAEFYSSLKGLLNAREALLKELSGDLAQVLADPNKRDLALKVLFGGIKRECIEQQGVISKDCIPPGSAAHFYRYVLGVGLSEKEEEDLKETTRLLQVIRYVGLGKIDILKLKASISGYEGKELSFLGCVGSGCAVKILKVMKKIVDEIYNKLGQVLSVPEPIKYDYRDLDEAFTDFLNKSIKLLPLYNPFTFFIQSLHSTPKLYLEEMYCKDLFENNNVSNLMNKYGIKLTKILDPGIGVQDVDELFEVVGHEKGSVGELLVNLVWSIYELTYELNRLGYPIDDELRNYVDKHKEYLIELINANDVVSYAEVKLKCGVKLGIKVDKGLVTITWNGRFDFASFNQFCEFRLRNYVSSSYGDYSYATIQYTRFLEVFSPLLFLGIAWISKDNQGTSMYILH
jgi:hypothetical protein